MRKLTKPGLYIISIAAALACLMLLLWHSTTIDLHDLSIQASNTEDQIFPVLNVSVIRDPFVYHNLTTAQSTTATNAPLNTTVMAQDSISPTAQMAYVGYLVQEQVKRAFVLYNDKMFVVRVGDFVGTQFRVAGIQNQSISLHKEPEGKVYTLYISGSVQ